MADTTLQVPLTYRDAPLEGADQGLVGRLEHSVLGTRWVYDGVRDERYVMMAAAAAITGLGQALGMVELEGRWYVGASPIRISGRGRGATDAPVDGFTLVSDDAAGSLLRNDQRELVVHRRPVPGPEPASGITATWDDREPVVLVELRPR